LASSTVVPHRRCTRELVTTCRAHLRLGPAV